MKEQGGSREGELLKKKFGNFYFRLKKSIKIASPRVVANMEKKPIFMGQGGGKIKKNLKSSYGVV